MKLLHQPLLWHALNLLGTNAAPIRRNLALDGRLTDPHSNKLHPRQYSQELSAFERSQEMAQYLVNKYFPENPEGMAEYIISDMKLFRTELTMAGALEPELEQAMSPAEAALQQELEELRTLVELRHGTYFDGTADTDDSAAEEAEEAAEETAEEAGEEGAIKAEQPATTAEEAGTAAEEAGVLGEEAGTVAEAGAVSEDTGIIADGASTFTEGSTIAEEASTQAVYMGDLDYLPTQAEMEMVTELINSPVYEGTTADELLYDFMANANFPEALTGLEDGTAEGLAELFPVVLSEMSTWDGVAVVIEGVNAMAAGVTGWAGYVFATIAGAIFTKKMCDMATKGWKVGLKAFGNLLKQAFIDEFHVDMNAPLPDGTPTWKAIEPLTNILYHIYAAVGEYERTKLEELGAPIQQFETKIHSNNVHAMKDWAQTEEGQIWCEDTKLKLVHALQSKGIKIDLSTTEIPLRKSCPANGTP